MNNKGYSLLEIIVAITIFSIFIAGITISFSTYTEVSKRNNIISIERIDLVSKLEKFLATKEYDEKFDNKITLIKSEGFNGFAKEIICIEKQEKSEKSGETFKAFVKINDKK